MSDSSPGTSTPELLSPSPPLWTILPALARTHLVNEKPHALVVRGVEPEHPVEDARCLLESIEPPETQAEPVHAAEKRPVVDEAPRQHAFEGGTERLLTDADAGLVGPDRLLGTVVEHEVAKVRMGVQAPEIGLAELHQDGVRGPAFTGVLEVIGFADRVGVGVVGIGPWQNLLHLERLPGATGDDGLGPFVNGLTLLAPVLLVRVPYALIFERERDEPQRGDVEPRRLDLS